MGLKKFILGPFEENTYILTKGDKAVVIDPGMGIQNILADLNNYTVEAVLLTHGHLDHMDGVGYFNAPIYVGKEDLIHFTDLSYSLYKQVNAKPSFDICQLQLNSLSDNEMITLPDFTIKAIHTPGHTRGSYCFLYQDMLFSGDTLFKGSCGRTDFPGGNQKAMRHSLERLVQELKDYVVVYPGHDEKTSIKDEKMHNPFVNY